MQPGTPTANDLGGRAGEYMPLAETTTAEIVRDGFSSALRQVIEPAPRVLTAVVVLIIGFLIARLVARGAAALAKKIGLQRAAEQGGLAESLRRGGIGKKLPDLIGDIIFWLLMAVFLAAACDILHLPGITVAVAGVVAYIPKVLVATIVVAVGMFLASLVRGLVATSADGMGIAHARQLAGGCYYVLVLMTLIAAFEQLEIKFDLLNYAILIAFGAVALALGISFGLGGRDVTAGMLCGYYVRQRFQPGDLVSIAGHEGIVREVGPVATIIESTEDGIMRRRSIPNQLMLKDAVR